MRLTLFFLVALSLPLSASGQERPPRPVRPLVPPPPVTPAPPLAPTPLWFPSLEWPLEYSVAPDLDGFQHLSPEPFGGYFDYAWDHAWDVTVPMPAVVWGAQGIRGRLPQQGTREDSLFRAAREALNRGEYQRASDLFRSFEKDFPRSRSATAALYWQAFALYRVGTQPRLEEARAALQAVRDRSAQAAEDPDVASLLLRVQGALAARGDNQAAARLRAAADDGGPCDKEEMAVRAEALNALVRSDATAAREVLERVLARRDVCSAPLRRRAVYLLGRSMDNDTATTGRLINVVRTDPDLQVRIDALSLVGRLPGATTLRFLADLARSDENLRMREAAINAISGQEGEAAVATLRTMIGDAQLEEELRAAAIASYASGGRYVVSASGTGGEAHGGVPVVSRAAVVKGTAAESEARSTYLRDLYGRLTERSLKRATLHGLGRIGGEANTRWLLDLARTDAEEETYRSIALSQIRAADLTAVQLGQLYDGLTSRSMRRSVINFLARRSEPEATDKLIEIARRGTDPETRRAAISALARKNDPRATQLLLELVEK